MKAASDTVFPQTVELKPFFFFFLSAHSFLDNPSDESTIKASMEKVRRKKKAATKERLEVKSQSVKEKVKE